MPVKTPAVGIDLGTTFSCVAVYQNGNVEVIFNDQGNRTTPSIVAFNDEERLIGETADEEIVENPTNVVRDVKRLIGRSFSDENVTNLIKHWPFQVVADADGKPNVRVNYRGKTTTFSPEQISSMILGKMKRIASEYLGKEVKDAVISVPAYFNNAQRQATMDAAKIAGLNVLQLIKEPTAAALAYGLQKTDSNERKVLIYDLGGGTFDVSILTVKGHEFEVKCYGGDPNLGGEDFNNRLADFLSEEFEEMNDQCIRNDQSARAKLRVACEKAKKVLSTAATAKISIRNLVEGVNFHYSITRAKFEHMNASLFRKTIDEVEEALNAAGFSKDDIDDVVLVGGSTRIPKIQELLQEFFNGKELNKSINPDEAVAYGAAIQAAHLTEGSSKTQAENFKFSDVVPLSLGVNCPGGIFDVIIPRNTPLPATITKIRQTVHDYQTSVSFQILEGERLMVADNNLLGQMTLNGIRQLKRGNAKMNVTFSIDANGSLHTKAVERFKGKSKKKSVEATINYSQKRLSDQELDRMIDDAKKFRLDDQEKLENAKAINDLQSFCLNMRDTIESTGKKMSADKKRKIWNEIQGILIWLKKGGHSKRDCQLKKAELKTFNMNQM